jgi:competence protein ComEC
MRKWVTGARPLGRWLLLAALLIAVVAWLALRGLPEGRLHVWFLDVGQGDAVLIRTPGGRQILVDGGPSPSALAAELGAVMPFWDRSLDLVILTHPDADHSAGLIPLFDRFRVDGTLDAVAAGDPDAGAWIGATGGVARTVAARGAQVRAGGALLTVLNPAFPPGAAETGNNDSLVLRIDYGATSLLLTGDAESEAEERMIAAGLPLRADVLKVGHHGSGAATSREFLAAVQPRLAVISVGAENRFGHPAPELLERLAGVEVLRTDQRGRIELISDGKVWTVR